MNNRLKILLPAGIILALALLLMPVLLPLTGNKGVEWMIALGRFHILVLHFPIALLCMVPIFELLGSFKSLKFVRQSAPTLLLLATLFSTKACVLGYMLATGEGDASGLLINHMWGGIITTVLMIAALIVRELYHHHSSNTLYRIYGLIIGFSILSLGLGSHNGASLVHGENYLLEKLPGRLKTLLHKNEDNAPQVTVDLPAYDTLIRPILKNHCFVCHSEAKQKSDFRMDDFELLLAGGESGMAGIEPNSLEDSEVYYRITLDPKKKGFMPPQGSSPLHPDQIELIRWWINNGASPDQTIAELSSGLVPEAVQKLLAPQPEPHY